LVRKVVRAEVSVASLFMPVLNYTFAM